MKLNISTARGYINHQPLYLNLILDVHIKCGSIYNVFGLTGYPPTLFSYGERWGSGQDESIRPNSTEAHHVDAIFGLHSERELAGL